MVHQNVRIDIEISAFIYTRKNICNLILARDAIYAGTPHTFHQMCWTVMKSEKQYKYNILKLMYLLGIILCVWLVENGTLGQFTTNKPVITHISCYIQAQSDQDYLL